MFQIIFKITVSVIVIVLLFYILIVGCLVSSKVNKVFKIVNDVDKKVDDINNYCLEE